MAEKKIMEATSVSIPVGMLKSKMQTNEGMRQIRDKDPSGFLKIKILSAGGSKGMQNVRDAINILEGVEVKTNSVDENSSHLSLDSNDGRQTPEMRRRDIPPPNFIPTPDFSVVSDLNKMLEESTRVNMSLKESIKIAEKKILDMGQVNEMKLNEIVKKVEEEVIKAPVESVIISRRGRRGKIVV